VTDETDRYGEWLKAEIEVWEAYHNHKETTAWTATAFFLAAGGAFVSTVPRLAAEHKDVATVVILLAAAAIWGFVVMQFLRRWSAADTTDGFRAALTKLYQASSSGVTLNRVLSTADDPYGVPQFVTDEIDKAKHRKRRRRPNGYKDLRWWSEAASYVLLVLTTASMVMAVRNPPTTEETKIEAVAREVARLSDRVSAMSQDFKADLAASEARLHQRLAETRGGVASQTEPRRAAEKRKVPPQ
jgi:hypothetical protein